MNKIYLDNNATTPIDKKVFESMKPFLNSEYYNPSSAYESSQKVRDIVEKSRKIVADFIGASSSEIIFTSGGTESINHAIKGVAFAHQKKGKHIITSSVEHPAVLSTCEFLKKFGFEITYIPVDKFGIVKLDILEKAIRKDTILISIISANNEIGTIQPNKEISNIAFKNNILYHTDAVQIIGKIPYTVDNLKVNLLSFSGHKFYCPKGIGVLYVKKGTFLYPLIHGGHQEKRRRAGTENVAGIVAIAKAVEVANTGMKDEKNKILFLKNFLKNKIIENIPDIRFNGHPNKSLFNTLNVGFKYIEGESILTMLDFEGIQVSTGSACNSDSLQASHVLLAMGIDKVDAHGSIRFSIGKYNTKKEIEKVADILPDIIMKLRKISPLKRD